MQHAPPCQLPSMLPTALHADAARLRCRHRGARRQKYRQFLTCKMHCMDHLSLPDLHCVAGWRRWPGCYMSRTTQVAHIREVPGSWPAPAGAPELLPEDTVGVHIGVDDFLDADFTASDVRACVHKISAGKAAGIDGMNAELLKHGPLHMQHCLTKLVTSMLKGTIPSRSAQAMSLQCTRARRRIL